MSDLKPYVAPAGTRAEASKFVPSTTATVAAVKGQLITLPKPLPVGSTKPAETKPVPPAADPRKAAAKTQWIAENYKPPAPAPKPAPAPATTIVGKIVEAVLPARKPLDTRTERRETFKGQPVEVRAVTIALMPETSRSIGAKLEAQKQTVQAVAAAPAADARAQAVKATALAGEAQKLASLVAASQALRDTKATAGVVALHKPLATATLNTVRAEAVLMKKELVDTKAAAAKAPNDAIKAGLTTRTQLLDAKIQEAAKREQLLVKGKDIDKPKRVKPATVTIQRKPLQLPAAFVHPTKGEVVAAAMVLTAAVKPEPQETKEAHKTRIRGLLERALARNARMQALGKQKGEAMSEAIQDAIRIDKPAIDAEVKETGGLAEDAASQVIEVFIDQVGAEVAQAAASSAPPVPTATPTYAQIEQTIAAASQEIAIDAMAPAEVWDEAREDIILADSPIVDVPWYTQPRYVAGGAVAAGIAYWLWRRNKA